MGAGATVRLASGRLNRRYAISEIHASCGVAATAQMRWSILESPDPNTTLGDPEFGTYITLGESPSTDFYVHGSTHFHLDLYHPLSGPGVYLKLRLDNLEAVVRRFGVTVIIEEITDDESEAEIAFGH